MPSKIIERVPVKEAKGSGKKSQSGKKKQVTIGSFFTKEKKSKNDIILIDVSDEDEQVIENISSVEKEDKGESLANTCTDSESGNLIVIEDQSCTDGSSQESKKGCRNLQLSMDAEFSNSSLSGTVDKQEMEDEVTVLGTASSYNRKEPPSIKRKINQLENGVDGTPPKECRNLLLSMDAECSNISFPGKSVEKSEVISIDKDDSCDNHKSCTNDTGKSKSTDLKSDQDYQYCLYLQNLCENKMKELVHLGKEEEMDQDLENIEEILKDMPCCTDEADTFPDTLLPYLACIVQGSPLSLSNLSNRARTFLTTASPKLSHSSIETKIKVLANRKAYLGNTAKLDETSPDTMWRWEVITYDMFPQNDTLTQRVKKRKAYRGKIRIWYNVVHRIEKAITRFLKAKDEDKSSILEQIRNEEQKLQKLEDEKKKALEREREKEQERMEKEKLQKERQRLKEAKQKERDLEKQMAKKLKEEEKEQARLLKEQEKEVAKKLKEEKLEEERKLEQAKLQKNKQRMLSFFSKHAKTSLKPSSSSGSKATISKPPTSTGFDSCAFRSNINSKANIQQPLFPTLSSKALKSRRRRTKPVEVTIESTSTVSPTQLQPCIELRVITVPNKYKFLKFFEDYRPPYCGTWSKSSSIISGKRPFEKDTTFLDYDYDSEAEWEEEEPGEDLSVEPTDDIEQDMERLDDEEGGNLHDTRTYNYSDGWMVDDDDAMDYSDDEDTKAVLRKENKSKKDFTSTSLLIVPPILGGLPPLSTNNVEVIVEGNSKNAIQEAKQIFKDLKCDVLLRETETEPSLISLDPFPPYVEIHSNKMDNMIKAGDPENNSSSNVKKTTLTTDELKLLARYVHHNELNSRDRLVDELFVKFQESNLEITNRALISRTVISVAEKKKVQTSSSGVVIYWEVKKDLLQELCLDDLLNTQPANLISAKKKDEEKAKRKAELEKRAEAKRIEMEEKAAKRKAEEEAAREKEAIKKIEADSLAEKKRKTDVSKASTNLFGAYFKKSKIDG